MLAARSLYPWWGAGTVVGVAVELPVLNGDPVCPAAFPIRGTCRAEQGVVCRIMQDDAEGDAGLRMTPRALEVVRDSAGGVYLNLKSDPSSVTAFCHGDAVPVVTDDERESGRASYTYCPVWQARRNADLAGQDELVVDAEPEAVAMGIEGMDEMGMSTLDAEDPWEAGRRALRAFDEAAA